MRTHMVSEPVAKERENGCCALQRDVPPASRDAEDHAKREEQAPAEHLDLRGVRHRTLSCCQLRSRLRRCTHGDMQLERAIDRTVLDKVVLVRHAGLIMVTMRDRRRDKEEWHEQRRACPARRHAERHVGRLASVSRAPSYFWSPRVDLSPASSVRRVELVCKET